MTAKKSRTLGRKSGRPTKAEAEQTLLGDLARVFARAAVDAFIARQAATIKPIRIVSQLHCGPALDSVAILKKELDRRDRIVKAAIWRSSLAPPKPAKKKARKRTKGKK